MVRRIAACIVVGLIVLGIGASAAHAQNGGVIAPFGGCGGGGGYGFGFFNYGGGINNSSDHIPFYALYPPVYYSFPVARPYGYSPFAYPPGTPTPDVAPEPVTYTNPFVKPDPDARPVAERVAADGSRTYYNPFVQQASNE
jgi:hypothetical protein